MIILSGRAGYDCNTCSEASSNITRFGHWDLDSTVCTVGRLKAVYWCDYRQRNVCSWKCISVNVSRWSSIRDIDVPVHKDHTVRALFTAVQYLVYFPSDGAMH